MPSLRIITGSAHTIAAHLEANDGVDALTAAGWRAYKAIDEEADRVSIEIPDLDPAKVDGMAADAKRITGNPVEVVWDQPPTEPSEKET